MDKGQALQQQIFTQFFTTVYSKWYLCWLSSQEQEEPWIYYYLWSSRMWLCTCLYTLQKHRCSKHRCRCTCVINMVQPFSCTEQADGGYLLNCNTIEYQRHLFNDAIHCTWTPFHLGMEAHPFCAVEPAERNSRFVLILTNKFDYCQQPEDEAYAIQDGRVLEAEWKVNLVMPGWILSWPHPLSFVTPL